MSGVLTTTPPSTKAHILRTLAKSRYPKLDKPNVAAAHHLNLVDLDAILSAHGWPDPAQMVKHAEQLEEQVRTESRVEPGQLAQVPVVQLHPDPANPREELVDIDELADSMREVGLLQPVTARRHDGRLVIVAGHRRLAAAKLLKWATVECVVRHDAAPDHVLASMLVENGQRAGLDPIEEARALARLTVQGMDRESIARKVGRGVAWVNSRLALLDLNEEEQEQIRAGHYSLTHANNLLREQARLRRGPTKGQVGRPKGAKTKPYFGDSQPLAGTVRARCDHRGSPKVGGVGCGACWEAEVRASEREQIGATS